MAAFGDDDENDLGAMMRGRVESAFAPTLGELEEFDREGHLHDALGMLRRKSPEQVEEEYRQRLREEGARRPKVDYGSGLFPATTIRANVGGTGTNGALDITANNGVLQVTGEPGILVALGGSIGYEVAEIGSANGIFFPLSCGSCFRNRLGLSYRAVGSPSGDLVLGWYPVDEETEENFRKATAQAKAFSGVPLILGSSSTSGSQTIVQQFRSAVLAPPIAIQFPAQVTGLNPGPVLIQCSPDTTGGGPNDPLAVMCFASTSAAAAAGAGVFVTPGGDFTWPGGTLWGCEQVVLAPALLDTQCVFVNQ